MAEIFVPPTMAAVRALIAQLEALGATIPADVAPLLAAHDRIAPLEAYAVGPKVPLADLGPEDVMRWAACRANDVVIRDTRVHAEDLLAAEVAGHLTAAADGIISELRPAFAEHAGYITAAHKVGVTQHTTAEDLLNMPAKAVTAWRAAVAHVDPLAPIAHARIAMTRTLGIAPKVDGSGGTFAACFSNAGRGWSRPEDPVTWLRLAAAGLVLQPVAETAALTWGAV